jgi:flagellar biosynthesis/type III secretory pathway chaperone
MKRTALQEGMRKTKLDIAKTLVDVLDNETIALKTGLEVEEIEQLRENKI